MKVRHVVSLSVTALLVSAGSAFAGNDAAVMAPKFGRDGVPTVTVEQTAGTATTNAQAFGREVPRTRMSIRARALAESGVTASRFGRS